MRLSDEVLQTWAREMALSSRELAMLLDKVESGDINDRGEAERYVWKLRTQGERL